MPSVATFCPLLSLSGFESVRAGMLLTFDPSGSHLSGGEARSNKGSKRTLEPQLLADDKLEPGPDLGDRADLHVDEPKRQSHLANDILGDRGRHFGGLLWPGYPNYRFRIERLAEASELSRKPFTLGDKQVDQVRARAKFSSDLKSVGYRSDDRQVVAWSVEDSEPRGLGKAELLGQWSSGVANWHGGSFAA